MYVCVCGGGGCGEKGRSRGDGGDRAESPAEFSSEVSAALSIKSMTPRRL